ncbi:MAG: ATP-binding cassette domain-containing protein [Cytophagales bacterium]
MISTSNVSLRYGKRVLFEEVNVKFAPGNCYGLIGANGAGKSTFLKILSGEIEATTGLVATDPGERLAYLKQNQFEFDETMVLHTVIMGHKRLYDIMIEKEKIYAMTEISDDDNMRAGELEMEFAELNGWEAEPEAAQLLSGLGITEDKHYLLMKDLTAGEKVKILLAQALFGSPDILLLDEPTNNLDLESINWLISFLGDFKNTVIVVSHDRHFLDEVCTHIADIDFNKIQLYSGNYSFWYESSQLALKQKQDANKKVEDKRKELQDFVARFSANASKSKQATSRKKLLEKLTLDDIKPSSRKYPYVGFSPNREVGNQILQVENLKKVNEGETLFDKIEFTVNKGDKIAFISKNNLAVSALFDILMEKATADNGTFAWGTTVTHTYFPKDNTEFFAGCDLSLVDWLRQYSTEKDESFVRGFLGRMLFSGEEALKKANVLSGGEKVRCMLSRMMLTGANVLVLDEPTNHLDLESITSVNNGLADFKGLVLFASQDYQFIDTIANRIIELTPNGIIDKVMTYTEYVNNDAVKELREKMYN